MALVPPARPALQCAARPCISSTMAPEDRADHSFSISLPRRELAGKSVCTDVPVSHDVRCAFGNRSGCPLRPVASRYVNFDGAYKMSRR